MTCHQKQVRERKSQTPLPDEHHRRAAASSFENATVVPLTKVEAKSVILDYEWLGNMGTTQFCYGLFFGWYLAGVACFGSTGGTNVPVSICGKEYASRVITLCRGACVHWAHPHSATYLINRACDLLATRENDPRNIFIAYSDADADEVGTVYQASNWLYVGKGGTPTFYVHPNGRKYDSLVIAKVLRDRTNRPNRKTSTPAEMACWVAIVRALGCKVGGTKTPYVYKMTRKEAHTQMLAEGFTVQEGTAKHRYVHFAGDKRTVRALRKALRLTVLPYPKREAAQFEANTAGTTSGGEVQLLGAAPLLS